MDNKKIFYRRIEASEGRFIMTRERIMDNYFGARYEDLFDAYTRPSFRKIQSWKNIEADCEKHGGWGLRVCGFNTCQYSAGYKYKDDETGQTRLRYFTRLKVYDIPYSNVYETPVA